MQVEWADGKKNEFDALMLRDNCVCGECLSATADERLKLTPSTHLDISIQAVHLENGAIVVHWKDGHISKYTSEWLMQCTQPDCLS